MKNIAILASGTGTNAEHMIRYFAGSSTVNIVVVLTNNPNAGVIHRAEKLRVPVEILSGQAFRSGEASKLLRQYRVDFVVLAGFLLLVPNDMLQAFPQRIINIHPSLLPKYGGKGMYGSHVHEAVIAAGESESGITIHYVDEHYDKGGVILQVKCPVLSGDTPDMLANRIHQLEYEYFPKVVEELLL